MKQKLWSRAAALLIVLVGAVATSCATIDPNERLTSDDCLVLIPTTMNNTSGANASRYYVVTVDNGVDLAVKNGDLGYLAIVIRKPQSLVSLASSVSGDRVTGNSTKHQIHLDLPYRPGEIVVFPEIFSQSMVKVSETGYQTSWDFVPLSEHIRAKVLDQFWASSRSSSWKGTPETPLAEVEGTVE